MELEPPLKFESTSSSKVTMMTNGANGQMQTSGSSPQKIKKKKHSQKRTPSKIPLRVDAKMKTTSTGTSPESPSSSSEDGKRSAKNVNSHQLRRHCEVKTTTRLSKDFQQSPSEDIEFNSTKVNPTIMLPESPSAEEHIVRNLDISKSGNNSSDQHIETHRHIETTTTLSKDFEESPSSDVVTTKIENGNSSEDVNLKITSESNDFSETIGGEDYKQEESPSEEVVVKRGDCLDFTRTMTTKYSPSEDVVDITFDFNKQLYCNAAVPSEILTSWPSVVLEEDEDIGCGGLSDQDTDSDTLKEGSTFEPQVTTTPSIVDVRDSDDDGKDRECELRGDPALPPCWTLLKRSLGDDSGFQEEFLIQEVDEEDEELVQDNQADLSSKDVETEQESLSSSPVSSVEDELEPEVEFSSKDVMEEDKSEKSESWSTMDMVNDTDKDIEIYKELDLDKDKDKDIDNDDEHIMKLPDNGHLDILCHVKTLERFRSVDPDIVLSSERIIHESEVDVVARPAGIANECLVLSHAQVTTVSVVEETAVSLRPSIAPVVSRTEAILATSNMLRACIGQPVLKISLMAAPAADRSTAQRPDVGMTTGDLAGDDDLLLRISPEEVTDPAVLDRMLNAATNYDQRRKIRAQIRLLRRKQHDSLVFDVTDDERGVKSRSMGVDAVAPDVWKTIDTLVASSFNGLDDSPNNVELNKELTSRAKMTDIVNGIHLLDIKDELKLHEMLDAAQDYEDRKLIRSRLKDVIASNRAQREEMVRRREEERENVIKTRLREADEQKRRTLAMYDAMSKSAPAGANKTMDISILRDGHGSGSSTPTGGSNLVGGGQRADYVEDSIRERQRDADERKKRILTAYDNAAKSGPAGAPRFIDFDNVKAEEVIKFGQNAPKPSSTFTMSGGIPIPCKPGTNVGRPQTAAPRDSQEEAIRRRQFEADERKRRTLEAYDTAARSRPAGEAVTVYIPQDDSVAPVIESSKRMSPRQKFQQLDTSVAPKGAAPAVGAPKAGPGLARSPTAIKEMLLNWCKSKTKEYENVSIDNFSTSWNDGMAFCALIHHFYPDAFDFSTLNPKNRRFNFDLAFRVAEEKGDVAPLLETDDMVMMKKPDWKCVFCYVQSLYRRFHNVD